MDAKIHCFSRVQPTGKKRTRCYNVAMKTGWVFLLDALLDGVMVTLALRLGGAKAPVWRIVLAALLGAAAARLCAAGLLGGTIQALSGATGSKATGLLFGMLAIPLLSAAMIRASRMRRDVQTVRVRMTYKKRTARFSAVVDSGNCLRDYLTHRPVIVIPQARGNRLFGLEDTPLRPIFADTAGGRQMMFCLTPERTILCDGRNEWAVEAMLALSPGLGGNAPALLPASLLNRKDGQEGA